MADAPGVADAKRFVLQDGFVGASGAVPIAALNISISCGLLSQEK